MSLSAFWLVSRPAAGLGLLAQGSEVGEVTDSSAIVWTRLTLRAQHNPADGPMVQIEYAGEETRGETGRRSGRPVYPEGVTVADIRDAVPGAGRSAGAIPTARCCGVARDLVAAVEADSDFTWQFTLSGLSRRRDTRCASNRGAGGGARAILDGRLRHRSGG